MSKVYSPEEDSYLLKKVIEKKLPLLFKKNPKLTFLEIGSGSGIQLKTALEVGVKKENIFSCDLNLKAISICKKLGFNCIESNLFENIKGKYDVIVFNPPYLPEDKDEPKDSKLATTGGKLGSEISNLFLKQSKKYLKENGRIFLLLSNLTKKPTFLNYNKKVISRKKLFFEELIVYELWKKKDT